MLTDSILGFCNKIPKFGWFREKWELFSNSYRNWNITGEPISSLLVRASGYFSHTKKKKDTERDEEWHHKTGKTFKISWHNNSLSWDFASRMNSTKDSLNDSKSWCVWGLVIFFYHTSYLLLRFSYLVILCNCGVCACFTIRDWRTTATRRSPFCSSVSRYKY